MSHRKGMRPLLRPVLLALLSLVALQAPAPTSAAWAKPFPPPPSSEKQKKGTGGAASAAAVGEAGAPGFKSLPQKLPYLLGAVVAASTTDYVVQKLFNETHRLELKHEKGQYKETLLYAGTSCTAGDKRRFFSFYLGSFLHSYHELFVASRFHFFSLQNPTK